MSKPSIPCDHCDGTGFSQGTTIYCGSCLGMGHVAEESVPAPTIVKEECSVWPNGTPIRLNEISPDLAFVYVCATRYAINRQTYAGCLIISELTKVADRMPYSDRKILEKEIAHALSTGEVDSVTRDAWVGLVDRLRELNAQEA